MLNLNDKSYQVLSAPTRLLCRVHVIKTPRQRVDVCVTAEHDFNRPKGGPKRCVSLSPRYTQTSDQVYLCADRETEAPAEGVSVVAPTPEEAAATALATNLEAFSKLNASQVR